MARKQQPQQNETLHSKIKEEVMHQLVEQFRISGDANRAARLLSAAYLLFTIGNQYAEETVELMNKHHIVRKKVKTTTNNLMQSFEAFDKEMQSMVSNGEYANRFCNESSLLREVIDVFITDKPIEVQRGPYFQPKLFLPEK